MTDKSSTTKLTRETVEHIAELAHLTLGDQQLDLFQEQLSDILGYAERLQELDTDAIPPTASVLPLRSVLRDDVPASTLSTDDALQNAPEAQDDCFVVPPLR